MNNKERKGGGVGERAPSSGTCTVLLRHHINQKKCKLKIVLQKLQLAEKAFSI